MAFTSSDEALGYVDRAIKLLNADGNPPERTGFGDSGAMKNITLFVQSAWDTISAEDIDVGPRPSKEDINLRPAYWLLKTMRWVADEMIALETI